MKWWILLLFVVSCADLTPSGREVRYIESDGQAVDFQDKADQLIAKHGCNYIGVATADTALFPPSYSEYENEVHAALRNRTAKMGGNLVVSNFYKRPALGVALMCPQQFLMGGE